MGKSYNRKVISIYTEFTAFMRRIKIFISSVQSEFSKERAMLCHYIRTDVLLGKFFEPFIFEEVPANEYPISHVYLNEVKLCDIYLGLYGNLYGYEDAEGVSPTEREYDLAAELTVTNPLRIRRAVVSRLSRIRSAATQSSRSELTVPAIS